MKYAHIELRGGGFEIGTDLVAPSSYVQGYISIGHSEDWDVVQRTGDDRIFVTEGANANSDNLEIQFPSIYHLILDEAQRSNSSCVMQGRKS